jgi:hypothetical protein
MLGEVLGRSERSHEALEPHRSLKDARLVAAAKRADPCHVELDRARFRLAIGPSLLLLRPGSCGGGALS